MARERKKLCDRVKTRGDSNLIAIMLREKTTVKYIKNDFFFVKYFEVRR